MRIIGGKDYYDHGLAYGQDDDVVFVRTGGRFFEYEVGLHELVVYGGVPDLESLPRHGADKKQRAKYDYRDYWEFKGRYYSASVVKVIFCGQFFTGVRITGGPLNEWSTRLPVERSDTYWDLNTLGKALAKIGMRLKPNEKSKKGLARRWFVGKPRRPLERGKFTGKALDFLIENRITVATHTEEDVETVQRPRWSYASSENFWRVNDDTLKDLDFIKVIDPVQAFQQISMWVGGVLPREGNPMVQITDDSVKLAKHGMDKWSFRKPPAQKER